MKHAARTNTTRSRFRFAWIAVVVFALVGIFPAIRVVSAAQCAPPGTWIAGTDVSGFERAKIVESVIARTQTLAFTVDIDGRVLTVPLVETGARVDAEATADAALATSNPIRPAVVAAFPGVDRNYPGLGRHLQANASIDEAAFEGFATRVDALAGGAPVPARVEFTDEGAYRAIPARTGYGVDRRALEEAVLKASSSQTTTVISLEPLPVEPSVTTEQAEAAAKAADVLISTDVSVIAPSGTWRPSPSDKAKWVVIADQTDADGRLTVSIDEDAVNAWVDEIVASVARDPIAAVDAVDEQGAVPQRARPGKPGVVSGNGTTVKNGLFDALRNARPYTGKLNMVEVPSAIDRRVAPSGSERFVYRAAPGEKWVDVNLTDSTLSAYEGETLVHGPVPVNHGGPGSETITGTNRVYYKTPVQDLGCTPEWPYCERQVPWIAYWHGDYALHAAPWVKEFGVGSGESSHGCVNLPLDEAQWVYEFVEVGTVVVTHY